MSRIRIAMVLIGLAVMVGACGSTGGTEHGTSVVEASGPTAEPAAYPSLPDSGGDCTLAMSSSELLAGPRSSLEETRAQLPLMKELHHDTRLIWSDFEIQPDHMMVDGWPMILIGQHDAADQCESLLAAVAHPELVRFVEWTEEDYSNAFDAGGFPPWRQLIEADVGYSRGGNTEGVWRSLGTGMHGVTSVWLRADQEALAAELLARYGELVTLEVGNFPYPPDSASTPVWCGSVPASTTPVGLAITSVSHDGNPFAGSIDFVVANDGPDVVHLVPQRIAELAPAGSNELVSAFTSPMTMELRSSTLLVPGATAAFSAMKSVAPCDPADGYALAPGTYDFVVRVNVFDTPADESRDSDQFVIARVPVELD